MAINSGYMSNEKLYFPQTEFYEEIKKSNNERSKKKIIETFEKIDLDIKNSDDRKRKGWIVKDTRKRSIITIFGLIEFKRTRFYNKYTKEVKPLADISIGINPYQKVCCYLQNQILNHVGSGNRYRDIVDIFSDSEISEMDISNIVKRFKIREETLVDLKRKKIDLSKSKNIYVETDDTFVSLKKNGQKIDYRIRLLVIHTGIKKDMHNRNLLENKVVDYQIAKVSNTISTISTVKKISKIIENNYENYEHCRFIVMGDGAKWISSLASEINAQFVLDKFHYIKKMREMFRIGKNSKTDKNIRTLFVKTKSKILNGNSIEDIFMKLDEVLLYFEKKNYNVQIKKLYEFVNFTNRNSDGIKNYYKDFSSQSHTEGMVSWFVKHTLGYGKKIYCYDVFINILNLKKYKNNGFDLLELLEYQKFESQDAQINKVYNEVNEYKTIGFLNRDKKSEKSISFGKYIRKSKGFIRT